MRPDFQELQRYYASLSDEALLEIERGDLTEVAQSCYDAELAARGLDAETDDVEIRHDDPFAEEDGDSGDELGPDWLEDAACACSFESSPGNDAAPDLDEARSVLEAAGIPCHAVGSELDAKKETRRYAYSLMVPAAMNMRALSVLDRDFFNPRLESEWKTHFADLSDDELRALSLQDLTAGMLDRVERLTKAYKQEMAGRGK
ncbi:MAG: hypothetical protein ABL995_09790 [Bryobacteraceae bacterium]